MSSNGGSLTFPGIAASSNSSVGQPAGCGQPSKRFTLCLHVIEAVLQAMAANSSKAQPVIDEGSSCKCQATAARRSLLLMQGLAASARQQQHGGNLVDVGSPALQADGPV